LSINALPPLPVVLPLSVAALLIATAPRLPRRVIDLLAIATALAVAILCALLLVRSLDGPIVYWFGGWLPRDGIALGISFVIDPFGAGLALLASVLVVASLIFTWHYFDEVGVLFPVLTLTFLGAMAGFSLTGDLFNLFVFFELMSVAAFALTGYKIEEEEALMGAFNFGVTNSIGAFLVLTGIGLLYGRTGALNLAQMGRTLASAPADGLVIGALVLISTGFAVKAALVPFHFWLADAHAVAPTPVCVLFSGVMVELGLYAVLRVYWTVFAGVLAAHEDRLRPLLLAAGSLTVLVGGVMCFAQAHLKRLLAFSTISHMGVFLMGTACLTADGLAGTGLYVLAHGLVKGGLFLAAGILLNRFESVDENVLRGRGKLLPAVGVLFTLGALGLSGLPPFGTWTGKALIEDAAADLGFHGVSVILFLSSALTGGAVLRVCGAVFLGWGHKENEEGKTPKYQEKETKKKYTRTPLVMIVPVGVLFLLALLAGLWPTLKSETVRAAARFENPQGYADGVLEGSAETLLAVGPKQPPPSGFLSSVTATAGAVVLALTALFVRRLPQSLRRNAWRVGHPALAVLRTLHSGYVGDYVVWIIVGVAMLGGLCAWRFG